MMGPGVTDRSFLCYFAQPITPPAWAMGNRSLVLTRRKTPKTNRQMNFAPFNRCGSAYVAPADVLNERSLWSNLPAFIPCLD